MAISDEEMLPEEHCPSESDQEMDSDMYMDSEGWWSEEDEWESDWETSEEQPPSSESDEGMVPGRCVTEEVNAVMKMLLFVCLVCHSTRIVKVVEGSRFLPHK